MSTSSPTAASGRRRQILEVPVLVDLLDADSRGSPASRAVAANSEASASRGHLGPAVGDHRGLADHGSDLARGRLDAGLVRARPPGRPRPATRTSPGCPSAPGSPELAKPSTAGAERGAPTTPPTPAPRAAAPGSRTTPPLPTRGTPDLELWLDHRQAVIAHAGSGHAGQHRRQHLDDRDERHSITVSDGAYGSCEGRAPARWLARSRSRADRCAVPSPTDRRRRPTRSPSPRRA